MTLGEMSLISLPEDCCDAEAAARGRFSGSRYDRKVVAGPISGCARDEIYSSAMPGKGSPLETKWLKQVAILD